MTLSLKSMKNNCASFSGKNGSIYCLICIFGLIHFIVLSVCQVIFLQYRDYVLKQELFYQEVSLKNWTWVNITEKIQLYRYMPTPELKVKKGKRKPVVKKPCEFPPKGLVGREEADLTFLGLLKLQEKFSPFENGGHFKPYHCMATTKIALIVPYRDRNKHLKLFLNNIIPKLTRQQIDFTIYVVEQSSGAAFNRGMMRNIGFKEASSMADYDCYIFNDVDTIPEDDRNFYFCEKDYVRHLVTKLGRSEYKLPYPELAGGIIAFTKEQFLSVNGYSNQFFVWGGEDDDIFKRLKKTNFTLRRPPSLIGTTTTFPHEHDPVTGKRYEVMDQVKNKEKSDGVSTLKYKKVFMEKRKLYTWIYVEIDQYLSPDKDKI